MTTKQPTGGRVNYYLVKVEHPQREEQPPYQAECEDITSALHMTPDEFCEFKAIWRTAAARQGNGKPGREQLDQAIYDAEKRVHYATRSLNVLKASRLSDSASPRVYISGPITGVPELNKSAFDAEESRLKQSGFSAFNPHSIPFPAEKLEKRALWQYFMRACIKEIPTCDVIRMLPGWENSAGATEELRVAKMLGLLVEYCEDAVELGAPETENA